MKVKDKKNENCQMLFTIEVEESEMNAAMDSAYKKASEQVEIPGFRKGKAPKSVLEKHLDKDKVWREAVETVAPDVCQKALAEEQITEHGQPYVEVIQPESPLILKATVPLPPKVELGDYNNLKIKRKEKKITAKEVNEKIDNLRGVVPNLVTVERPVQAEDMVTIDLEGRVDGKPFVNEKGTQYNVKPQEDSNLKGLADHLIGMKAGEEKSFNISLPDDFPTPEMAGKEVAFIAKMLEVKEKELPPLTDELAKKLSPDVQDVKGLKKKIKTHLEKKEAEQANQQFETSLLDELVSKSTIEYPPQFLDSEIDGMIERQVHYWQMLSRSKEEFEETLKQTSYEQLKEQFKQPAETNLKRSLILSTFINKEQISVSSDEVKAEVERRKNEPGGKKEEKAAMLDKPETQRAIANELMTKKALGRLAEINDKSANKSKQQEKQPEEKSKEDDNNNE